MFSYRRPIYVVTSNSPTVCWCSCRVWRRCGVQRILMNPNVCVSECTLPDTLNSWFLVAQLHVWWVAQTHPLSYQFIRYSWIYPISQSDGLFAALRNLCADWRKQQREPWSVSTALSVRLLLFRAFISPVVCHVMYFCFDSYLPSHVV